MIVGVIQARMDSSRLPGKMSMRIGNYPLIDWVIRRSKKSKLIDRLVLATSVNQENDYLEDRATDNRIKCFRGSEENVLSRFTAVSHQYSADTVVRICADNPFICPKEIDRIIKVYMKLSPHYAFNHIPALGNKYVDGVGAEFVMAEVLYDISKKTSDQQYLEHVTKYLWDNIQNYKVVTVPAPSGLDRPNVKLDIDTMDDYLALREIIDINEKPENQETRKLIRDFA